MGWGWGQFHEPVDTDDEEVLEHQTFSRGSSAKDAPVVPEHQRSGTEITFCRRFWLWTGLEVGQFELDLGATWRWDGTEGGQRLRDPDDQRSECRVPFSHSALRAGRRSIGAEQIDLGSCHPATLSTGTTIPGAGGTASSCLVCRYPSGSGRETVEDVYFDHAE